MSEVNAQLGPFANLFRSGGEKKSTWNSAARDVAKCIKKIAGIRWKRLSLALVFTMVWREVHAGLNCERCFEEKKKSILRLAVKTQVGVMCRFMHHTLTATQVNTVKTRSVQQRKLKGPGQQNKLTCRQIEKQRENLTAVQIWRAAPAFGCNNVDDLFCCSVLTDSRSTVARWWWSCPIHRYIGEKSAKRADHRAAARRSTPRWSAQHWHPTSWQCSSLSRT